MKYRGTNHRNALNQLSPADEPDYSGFRVDTLLRERTRLIGEYREAVDAAEARGSLSVREEDKIDAKYKQIRELDETIEKARQAQGLDQNGRYVGPPTGDRSSDAALTPEQRMADWYAARHGSFGIGGDGLTPAFEAREFSLGRIAGALLGRLDRSELSDSEQRAMAEGVDASGGFLVPEILSSNVIDRVRNKAAVFAAGALTIPMDTDTTNLARLAGGNSANWKSENAAVTESDETWERVQLRTKTAVVLQRVSQELFEDLSPEGARVIENEILQALALKLDLAALRGSGVDPEPRGIRNQTGVNIVSLGANGATPTNYDFLIDALSAVRDANGEPKAAIYASRTAKTLDKLKDSTGQPLNQPGAVAELSKFVSNQIPINLTQGTSTDTSEAYVGDFSTVLIGLRPTIGMRVKVLSERYADNLQIGLIAWIRGDVGLAHPEHLSVVTGIRP
jgi:HK97 family phage major capsid protein